MAWAAAIPLIAAGVSAVGGIISSQMGKGGDTDQSNKYDRQYTYDTEAEGDVRKIGGKFESMAEDQWNMYDKYFRDYEIQAVQSNKEMLPYITNYSKEAFGQLTQTTRDFQTMAREGIDTSRRMDEAEAGVVGAFEKVPQAMKMNAAAYGIDPSSRRFQTSLKRMGIDEAKAIAGARTMARDKGESEQFSRLALASGREPTNTGMVNTAQPAQSAAGFYGMAQGSYQPLANRVLQVSQRGEGAFDDKSNVFDYVGDVGNTLGGYALSRWTGGEGAAPDAGPSVGSGSGEGAGNDAVGIGPGY